ncbi:hypothetical protein ACH4RC_39565, partial [Streptomyces sp. NPDC016845]
NTTIGPSPPAAASKPSVSNDPNPRIRKTTALGLVLLAYFSRPGETYCGGRTDLNVGNTEVLAEKIADRIACDTYRIQAADPTRTTTTRR